MKKLLSIDQAATLSGWSYWEDEKLIEWGTIEPTPKSAKGGRRLTSLRAKFSELIDKYKPSIILIENPVGGEEDKNPKGHKNNSAENNWITMQVLCQVQGMLLQLIDEKNVNVEIVSPSSWQDTCGIHKRDRISRKAGAKSFVERQYKLDNVIQDVCDSVCIAYHYFEINRPERSAW